MIFIRLAADEDGTKKHNTIALLLLCKLHHGKEGLRCLMLGNDDEAKYKGIVTTACIRILNLNELKYVFF